MKISAAASAERKEEQCMSPIQRKVRCNARSQTLR
jgi:hypothetical protein